MKNIIVQVSVSFTPNQVVGSIAYNLSLNVMGRIIPKDKLGTFDIDTFCDYMVEDLGEGIVISEEALLLWVTQALQKIERKGCVSADIELAYEMKHQVLPKKFVMDWTKKYILPQVDKLIEKATTDEKEHDSRRLDAMVKELIAHGYKVAKPEAPTPEAVKPTDAPVAPKPFPRKTAKIGPRRGPNR